MDSSTTETFYTVPSNPASVTIHSSLPPYTPDRSNLSDITPPQTPLLPKRAARRKVAPRYPSQPLVSISLSPTSTWSHFSELETYEVPVYPYTQLPSDPPGDVNSDGVSSSHKLTCLRLAAHNLLQYAPDVAFWTVNIATFVVALPFLVVYEVGWMLVLMARWAWRSGRKASFRKVWKGVEGWKGWERGLKGVVALLGMVLGF